MHSFQFSRIEILHYSETDREREREEGGGGGGEPGRQTNSTIAKSAFPLAESHCPDHARQKSMLRLCLRTDLETLSSESAQIMQAAPRELDSFDELKSKTVGIQGEY